MKKTPVREAIISTASRLFYQQGYSNTGINQIIEEANIAKSSLYQNFRSKEDLLLAYLEKNGSSTAQLLKSAALTGDSPKEKMIGVFDYLEKLVQQEEFYGCHFLNIVYEMPLDAVRVREQIKKQKDTVRDLFAEILKPINKDGLADEIYTLFEGALIGNKVHKDLWPIIAARNIVKKIL